MGRRLAPTVNDEFGWLAGKRSGDVRGHAGVVAGVRALDLRDEERIFVGQNESAVAIDLHGLSISQPGDLQNAPDVSRSFVPVVWLLSTPLATCSVFVSHVFKGGV